MVIVAAALLMAALLISRFLVPKAQERLFPCAAVREGELQETYGVKAEVTAPSWRQYFPGSVTRALVSLQAHVEDGEEVLEYLDPFGRKVKLKARQAGCLLEIGNGWVDFLSDDKRITALIPQQKLDVFRADSQYLFECNGRQYPCHFTSVGSLGIRDNDAVLYEGQFELGEDTELRIGMAGRLKVTLRQFKGVMLIDERCLYSADGKFFLLRKQWLDSFRNRDRYLMEAEVLGFSDGEAAIKGVGLSGQEFVIIDDTVRSLLDD